MYSTYGSETFASWQVCLAKEANRGTATPTRQSVELKVVFFFFLKKCFKPEASVSVSGEKGCASLTGFPENNLGFQVSVAGRLAAHQPALHSVEDPQEGPDHPHVSDSPRVGIVTVTSQRLSGEPDGDSFPPQPPAQCSSYRYRRGLPLRQRRAQNDVRTDTEVLQEDAGGERSEKCHRGTLLYAQ